MVTLTLRERLARTINEWFEAEAIADGIEGATQPVQPDYDLADHIISQLQPVYGVIYYKAGNTYAVEAQNKDEALDLYHNVIPPRGLESYLGCEKELVRRYSFDAWETIEEEDVS